MEKNDIEDQSNYRLNEISKIRDYFNDEIQYRQSLTNKLSKYLTISRNYIKKKNELLGLITSMFSLLFSLSFGITIKLQQERKLKKKKHNKLLYSAKNKLDCIEMLISNSINDGIITHDEFLEILKEKKEYNNLKMKARLKLYNLLRRF